MVDYHYDTNNYKRLTRRRRRFAFAGAAALLILLVIGYVIYDGLTAPTNVSEPIATEVTLGEATEQKVFEKPTYTLTTDPTWTEIEVRNNRYDSSTYHSIEDGLVKRELTIYVNGYPNELPVTYVLPVEIQGDEVTPLALSPKCNELQERKNNKRDVQLSWAGVEFLCDPDLNAFVAAASHNETGYGLEIAGTLSDATYTFVYKDFEAVAQPIVFQELLRDFQAK